MALTVCLNDVTKNSSNAMVLPIYGVLSIYGIALTSLLDLSLVYNTLGVEMDRSLEELNIFLLLTSSSLLTGTNEGEESMGVA